jgi:hypothetical protein
LKTIEPGASKATFSLRPLRVQGHTEQIKALEMNKSLSAKLNFRNRLRAEWLYDKRPLAAIIAAHVARA